MNLTSLTKLLSKAYSIVADSNLGLFAVPYHLSFFSSLITLLVHFKVLLISLIKPPFQKYVTEIFSRTDPEDEKEYVWTTEGPAIKG